MKNVNRYFLPVAVILGLALGAALAQNINKSLQQSQDPTGAIGLDAGNNVYFPAHTVNTGSAPSIGGGCGTGATVTGNDTFGLITEGSTEKAQCIITFRNAYTGQSVYCNVALNYATTATPISWTSSAAGLSINHIATTAVLRFNYLCNGSQ